MTPRHGRRRPAQQSVDRGREAERDVARRFNRWAGGAYTFKRRGLGHASVADLVVDGGPPAWPFVISVKAAAGPSLAALLERASAGEPLPWWRELEGKGVELAQPELVERHRARAWLVWRSGGSPRWLLSCWSLGALQAPVRLTFLPTPAGWPRFTLALALFLETVKVEHAMAAIAEGWGQA